MSYARRMLALNDEALSRLTDSAFEGEIRLGVPHDIVYPQMPGILKALGRRLPAGADQSGVSFTEPC